MRRVGPKRWSIIRSETMREKHPFIGTVCEEAVGSPSKRGGTMTTLMDTVRIEAPKRSPVRPVSPLDPSWDNASEPRSFERSFEVESRGGYARTVVGRLAYFDDEAQTYMVLTRDGVLVRVPLRDITSSHGFPRRGAVV